MKSKIDHIPLSGKDRMLIKDAIAEANNRKVKLLFFVQSGDEKYQARKDKIQALILEGIKHPVQYARYTWKETDSQANEKTAHLLDMTVAAFTDPGDAIIEIFSNPDNKVLMDVCDKHHNYYFGYFFHNKANQLI